MELILSEIETPNPQLALSVSTKAILVDALQKRGLRYSTHAEQAMEKLLTSCKGEELTKLKVRHAVVDALPRRYGHARARVTN